MPDYLDSDQVKLVAQKLLTLTQTGSLSWQSIDQSPFFFFVSVPDFRYEIGSRDADDSHPFELKIRQRYTSDDKKHMVRTLQTIETGDGEWQVDEDLELLYETAQRQALGLDGVANQILASLEAFNPDDKPPF